MRKVSRKMKRVRLGKTDMYVNAIGLGCMGLTHASGLPTPKEEAVEILRKAHDMGYDFYDTAECYTGVNPDGSTAYNEEVVGEAVKPFRKDIILCTKFGVKHMGNHLEFDSSPETIRKSLEGSLKKLQTDYVDIYYQHRIDPKVEPEVVAGVMKELIEEGKAVIQETRRWDDNKESSHAMRSKEDAQDYRYFPEPDLVPIVIDDEWIEKIKAKQPEFRDEKLERYKKEFDIPQYDAEILTESKHMADIFEETTAICGKPKKVSNWLMVETMRLLKEHGMEPEDISFSPANLAKLIGLTEAGTINSSVAKEVFEQVFEKDVDPESYVEEHGLKTVNDEGALEEVLKEVIAKNPKAIADYKGGKEKALGALVGQTMKAMKGKANPGMVNEKLREMLK